MKLIKLPILFLMISMPFVNAQEKIISNQKINGYKGIWFDLGQYSDYGPKYSGGLGTYTAKHVPLAVYAKEVNKTFFVYGGSRNGERYLLCMAGCYDHNTGMIAKPTLVHDKQGVNDPHDNPSMCIDQDGYIWVFVSGRGRHRMGYKYRSLKPYSIAAFEQILKEEMTYPQPWWIQDQGFLLLYTKYTNGRELYWQTSPDGVSWTLSKKLAAMGGHYQTSSQCGNRVITAFNMHPKGNVDKRTNLYFLQTDDMGTSWKTISGNIVQTPLKNPHCDALVRDFETEGRLVYVKDIKFDAEKNPVVLIITSQGHQPGPDGGRRAWTIVRWTGRQWLFSEVTSASHNYDQGSLYIEADGPWRLIAPTEPGPQPYGTGGELALWTSFDKGFTWHKERDITINSTRNHGYCRAPINAHPDFYAFWADGNPYRFSISVLYFTNKYGDTVCQMPYNMDSEWAKPHQVIY